MLLTCSGTPWRGPLCLRVLIHTTPGALLLLPRAGHVKQRPVIPECKWWAGPSGRVCWAALRFDLFIFFTKSFFGNALLRFFFPSSFLPSDFDVSTRACVGRIWAFRNTAEQRVHSRSLSSLVLGLCKGATEPQGRRTRLLTCVPCRFQFLVCGLSSPGLGSQAETSGPKVCPGPSRPKA